MPNILQFVYTELNTLLAANNLAVIIISGLTDALEISNASVKPDIIITARLLAAKRVFNAV